MNKKFLFLIVFLALTMGVKAQFYSVRTNLIGLATTNLNVELSMALNRKWSIHLPVQYNPFVLGDEKTNRQFRNLTVQPGVRYWLVDSYAGMFVGINGVASRFHIGNLFDKKRYDGSAFGGGVSFGNAWVINTRWNFELEAGLGLVWADYDKYKCKKCGLKLGSFDEWRVIPTKIAVNIVYLF